MTWRNVALIVCPSESCICVARTPDHPSKILMLSLPFSHNNCPCNCWKQPPPSKQYWITDAASTFLCATWLPKKTALSHRPPFTWRILIACLEPKGSVVCGLPRSPTDCQALCCLKTHLIYPNWPLSALAEGQQTTLPLYHRSSMHTALGIIYSSFIIMLMDAPRSF